MICAVEGCIETAVGAVGLEDASALVCALHAETSLSTGFQVKYFRGFKHLAAEGQTPPDREAE